MGVIRIILALSVVIAHSSPIFGFTFTGGQIAVQTFYIISGFYMAFILNEKYIDKNNSYLLFISNRFLRLFPIYWTVLLLTFLLCILGYFLLNNGLILNGYFNHTINITSWGYFVFCNLFILGQDLALFLGLDETGSLFLTTNFRNTSPRIHHFLFVPQAWTIGIEIMFYLIAPFIVRRKAKFLFVILSASICIRLLIYNIGLNHDPWTYRFFLNELVFFIIGIYSYNLYKKIKYKEINKQSSSLIWILLVLITLFYQYLPNPYNIKKILYFFSVFFSVPFIFILFKNNLWDRWLGELSYPIYITHIFFIKIINTFFNLASTHIYSILVIVSSILFSILLINFISKPIEKFRHKRILS